MGALSASPFASKVTYFSHPVYSPPKLTPPLLPPSSVLPTATAGPSMESIAHHSPSRRCCFILSHHGDAFFIFSSAAASMVVRVCPFTSALLHRGVIADDLFCSHAEARAKVPPRTSPTPSFFLHPSRCSPTSFHSVLAAFQPENLPPDFQNRGLFLGRFRRYLRGSSWPAGVSAPQQTPGSL